MNKILIVEDSPEIMDANRQHFETHDFEVHAATTGEEALLLLSANTYDCILLDVMLPGMDGYDVFEQARALTDAPIMFLTCLDELDDRLKGLEKGADDYLTKPYSLRELLIRVQNLIRKTPTAIISADNGNYLDAGNNMLHTPKNNIFFSAKEFALFRIFYENPGRAFSNNELMDKLWPNGNDSGIVAVYISRLRRKLASVSEHIGALESTYGEGYRYIPRGDGDA